MLKWSTLLLAVLWSPLAWAQVTLRITNANPPHGTLNISVFNQAEGFPSQPDKAFKVLQLPVRGTMVETVLELPPGRYAVALHHDVNGNGKMDSNFMGIPREPYGASNDARGKLGPPKYQDAVFAVAAGQPLTVPMQLTTF